MFGAAGKQGTFASHTCIKVDKPKSLDHVAFMYVFVITIFFSIFFEH